MVYLGQTGSRTNVFKPGHAPFGAVKARHKNTPSLSYTHILSMNLHAMLSERKLCLNVFLLRFM